MVDNKCKCNLGDLRVSISRYEGYAIVNVFCQKCSGLHASIKVVKDHEDVSHNRPNGNWKVK